MLDLIPLTTLFLRLTLNYDFLYVKGLQLTSTSDPKVFVSAISETRNVPEPSLSCLSVPNLSCCSSFCILLNVSSLHHSSSFILGLVLPSLSFLCQPFWHFWDSRLLHFYKRHSSPCLWYFIPELLWWFLSKKTREVSGLYILIQIIFIFPVCMFSHFKNVRCNGGSPSTAQSNFSLYWVLVSS